MVSVQEYWDLEATLKSVAAKLNNNKDNIEDLEKVTTYLLKDTGDHGCAASGFFCSLNKYSVTKYLIYVTNALEKRFTDATKKDESKDCMKARREVSDVPRIINNLFTGAYSNPHVQNADLDLSLDESISLYKKLTCILNLFDKKWFGTKLESKYYERDRSYLNQARTNKHTIKTRFEGIVKELERKLNTQ